MNQYNPNIHHRRSIRLKGYDYLQAGLYFITICVQDRKCLFGKIENDEMILNEFGMIAYQQWGKLPERFTNMVLDVFQIMPNHMHGIIMLTDTVGATLAVAPNDDNNTKNDAVAHDDNNNTETLAVAPNDNNNTKNDAVAHDDNNNTKNDAVAHDDNNNTENDAVAPDELVNALRAGASLAPTNTKTVGDIVGAYKSLVANGCLEIFKQNHPGKMMGKLWQRNYYEHIIRDEQSYQRISDYIINNPKNWNNDKFFEESI